MEMTESILNTMKDGYNPARYWHERTKNNLAKDSLTYYRDAEKTDGTKEFFAKFLPYLPEGSHDYIEMGCGYGICVDAIKTDPNFASYIGVDVIAERIEKARELHPEETFFWDNITTCVFACEFNVIFFNNVLQHLPLKEKRDAIKNAKRLIRKKDGVILMREGRFMPVSLKKCEEYYRKECPAHMIPTPRSLLRRWLKPWKLEAMGDCLFVARR